jgi:hypothetical protein
MAEDVVVLVVWALGFGILAVYVAVLTWLDNRLGRKDPDDAPVNKE